MKTFQAHHTYTRTLPNGDTEHFRVDHITTRPEGTTPFASGWKGRPGSTWYGRLVPAADCHGWTDTTPEPDTKAAAELTVAEERIRTSDPRIDNSLRGPIRDLLESLAEWAGEYPEMVHDHDRPACGDYACDVMGRSVAFARAILGDQP